MEWIIRDGTQEEVKHFQLFDRENDGDDILVLEVDGDVKAYCQHTDYSTVYFLESEIKGGGTALIEHIQSVVDYIHLVNVVKSAEGFYNKLGFERIPNLYGGFQFDMDWYEE